MYRTDSLGQGHIYIYAKQIEGDNDDRNSSYVLSTAAETS